MFAPITSDQEFIILLNISPPTTANVICAMSTAYLVDTRAAELTMFLLDNSVPIKGIYVKEHGKYFLIKTKYCAVIDTSRLCAVILSKEIATTGLRLVAGVGLLLFCSLIFPVLTNDRSSIVCCFTPYDCADRSNEHFYGNGPCFQQQETGQINTRCTHFESPSCATSTTLCLPSSEHCISRLL